MKTNDCERLVRKTKNKKQKQKQKNQQQKTTTKKTHIHHLVLNARDLFPSLAFLPRIRAGSSVGNATWLALLRHFLPFTRIRRAGQRTSGLLSSCCIGVWHTTFALLLVEQRRHKTFTQLFFVYGGKRSDRYLVFAARKLGLVVMDMSWRIW